MSRDAAVSHVAAGAYISRMPQQSTPCNPNQIAKSKDQTFGSELRGAIPRRSCPSGLKVGEDVEIKFTGMRRGENLFEELTISGEEYGTTQHPKIACVRNAASLINPGLYAVLPCLEEAAARDEGREIVRLLGTLIPEYRSDPAHLQGREAAEAQLPYRPTAVSPDVECVVRRALPTAVAQPS